GSEFIIGGAALAVSRRPAAVRENRKAAEGVHGRSNETEISRIGSRKRCSAALNMSKHFPTNLDNRHSVAADSDPVACSRHRHHQMLGLHLKARKKNKGPNTPWGQGDTPIREVLVLIKQQRWPIRGYVEYEYKGEGTPVDEVKKCYAYAKAALV